MSETTAALEGDGHEASAFRKAGLSRRRDGVLSRLQRPAEPHSRTGKKTLPVVADRPSLRTENNALQGRWRATGRFDQCFATPKGEAG
jgi:hypothetical protein